MGAAEDVLGLGLGGVKGPFEKVGGCGRGLKGRLLEDNADESMRGGG